MLFVSIVKREALILSGDLLEDTLVSVVLQI